MALVVVELYSAASRGWLTYIFPDDYQTAQTTQKKKRKEIHSV